MPVIKRTLASGSTRWRAFYRDREHKQHEKLFKRKIDATRWLEQQTSDQITGVWVDPKRARATLGAQADAWMASHPEWAESTRVRNKGVVEKHLRPRWGKVSVGNITTESIQEWSAGIGLAPGSIRKIVGVLSSILDYAVTTKHLGVNPAQAVSRPRQPLSHRRYLSVAELEGLADAAGAWRPCMHVLGYCGLRFGEMAALKVRAVDVDRRRFNVEASVNDAGGRINWSAPKDHQRRSVPYPSFMASEIEEQVKDKDRDALVFPNRDGGPLRIGNARRDWFDTAVRAAGLGKLTPHELRHTAASIAVASGASVLALQRMLGHDKPSTTLDVYSDLFDNDLDRLADTISDHRRSALERSMKDGSASPAGRLLAGGRTETERKPSQTGSD